jgi:hypothetical protein
MQCRDAQFYLRLRRHAGDELGPETAAALDAHLAGCAACAFDARRAESFDQAVALAMRDVPVPAGLRDKLFTQVASHRGGVIRRKAYRVAALAASVFLATGLAFGLFSAARPRIDTGLMVTDADALLQDPDEAVRKWLADQKLPDRLPLPFNTDLLVSLGKETVQGADVPVLVFRHPGAVGDPHHTRGFAKVYVFRTDGEYDLKALKDTHASHTQATVIPGKDRARGVTYVVLHTVHGGPGDDPLAPFLRPGRDQTRRAG